MTNKTRLTIASFAIIAFTWPAFGGQVGGAKRFRDTVMPGSTDVFEMVFEKETEAKIYVVGDGSSDLDCYVYDSGGELIISDTDNTDTCLLVWTPAWTGKFKLKIRNHGSKPNEYRAETN